MTKYIILFLIIILELMAAYYLKIEYDTQIDLYNTKIESFVPWDQTKHKTRNFNLIGKG